MKAKNTKAHMSIKIYWHYTCENDEKVFYKIIEDEN